MPEFCDDDDDLEIETESGFLQALDIVTSEDGSQVVQLYIDNAGPIDTVVPIGRVQAVELYEQLGKTLAKLGWLASV